MMAFFRIGEIAQKADVAASTIRYYEQMGLLPPAQRVSGKRQYDASILQKLKVIRLARQAGLSIAEVQTLVHEFPDNTPPSTRWQALATTKIPELDAQIQHLQSMKTLLESTLNCHCATLDDCGDSDC
jgi:MerR family transcriptional regulator, redox-sensitive transcriptional activator SoxR